MTATSIFQLARSAAKCSTAYDFESAMAFKTNSDDNVKLICITFGTVYIGCDGSSDIITDGYAVMQTEGERLDY
jgi:hypothetical protein